MILNSQHPADDPKPYYVAAFDQRYSAAEVELSRHGDYDIVAGLAAYLPRSQEQRFLVNSVLVSVRAQIAEGVGCGYLLGTLLSPYLVKRWYKLGATDAEVQHAIKVLRRLVAHERQRQGYANIESARSGSIPALSAAAIMVGL